MPTTASPASTSWTSSRLSECRPMAACGGESLGSYQSSPPPQRPPAQKLKFDVTVPPAVTVSGPAVLVTPFRLALTV